MQSIYAEYSASWSEIKSNPRLVLEQAEMGSVVILNENKPAAYLIPAELYETILERLEDKELEQLIHARKSEKNQAIEVSLDAI